MSRLVLGILLYDAGTGRLGVTQSPSHHQSILPPITYLLVLFEGIAERVQALGLVGVHLPQWRGHHLQVLLVVPHLSHGDTVEIILEGQKRTGGESEDLGVHLLSTSIEINAMKSYERF